MIDHRVIIEPDAVIPQSHSQSTVILCTEFDARGKQPVDVLDRRLNIKQAGASHQLCRIFKSLVSRNDRVLIRPELPGIERQE
jgi:hypothetical protein